MKRIRTSIFETNSSSTHSISMLRLPLPTNPIPRNEHIILELYDYISAGEKVFYRTSLSKLCFLINLLIIYVVDHLGNYNIQTYDDFIKWSPYTWLEEVVYEMTRSTFEIGKDYIVDEFPFLKYYKKLPDLDDSGVLRLFRCIRENDKDTFKETVNIIIFDDDAVIVDEEYYDDERCVVWEK